MAFLVWAGVAGSAVFWGLKLFVRPLAVPAQALVAVQPAVTTADLSPLFGVPPPPPATELAPPPPEASRFQLLGVVAGVAADARSQGVALMAVDGKTPRAYRVGAAIDEGLVLQSVQARKVDIGPRGGVATVSLELPPLPPPATGVPTLATGVPVPALQGAAPRMPLPPQGFPRLAPSPGTTLQDRLRALSAQGAPPPASPPPLPQQQTSLVPPASPATPALPGVFSGNRRLQQ